ncbi:hypothetical protein [Pseudoalteromonas sp.]|uniref:hypothetical protein n=1 Tax=Pseudoalteromonas sp. TaxID=53249 RepID=UPI00262BFE7F|nr:hypothetical protein [Pseudoalteromonas sp.]MCP4585342.1 hypothetical protein [Pseudoalteromonas sp.]
MNWVILILIGSFIAGFIIPAFYFFYMGVCYNYGWPGVIAVILIVLLITNVVQRKFEEEP